jgi:hypothetical protein
MRFQPPHEEHHKLSQQMSPPLGKAEYSTDNNIQRIEITGNSVTAGKEAQTIIQIENGKQIKIITSREHTVLMRAETSNRQSDLYKLTIHDAPTTSDKIVALFPDELSPVQYGPNTWKEMFKQVQKVIKDTRISGASEDESEWIKGCFARTIAHLFNSNASRDLIRQYLESLTNNEYTQFPVAQDITTPDEFALYKQFDGITQQYTAQFAELVESSPITVNFSAEKTDKAVFYILSNDVTAAIGPGGLQDLAAYIPFENANVNFVPFIVQYAQARGYLPNSPNIIQAVTVDFKATKQRSGEQTRITLSEPYTSNILPAENKLDVPHDEIGDKYMVDAYKWNAAILSTYASMSMNTLVVPGTMHINAVNLYAYRVSTVNDVVKSLEPIVQLFDTQVAYAIAKLFPVADRAKRNNSEFLKHSVSLINMLRSFRDQLHPQGHDQYIFNAFNQLTEILIEFHASNLVSENDIVDFMEELIVPSEISALEGSNLKNKVIKYQNTARNYHQAIVKQMIATPANIRGYTKTFEVDIKNISYFAIISPDVINILSQEQRENLHLMIMTHARAGGLALRKAINRYTIGLSKSGLEVEKPKIVEVLQFDPATNTFSQV